MSIREKEELLRQAADKFHRLSRGCLGCHVVWGCAYVNLCFAPNRDGADRCKRNHIGAGANDIKLDEATTGLAYQIEAGFLIPASSAGYLKLSGTLRGASYNPDSGPYNTTAFIWSVGFMFAP